MNRFIVSLFLVSAWLLSGCESGQSSETDATSVVQSDSLQTVETPMQAITRLDNLIKDNPSDYGLLQERALIWYGMDSLAQANKDIDEALRLYPQSPELHYLKGLFAKVEDNALLAMKEFTTAVSMGTQNPEVHYELGQQFFFRKDYDKALEAYQAAAQLDENDPQYIFAQAFLEQERGNNSKALSLYRQSLELDSLFIKSLTSIHDLYYEEFGSETDAAAYNDKLLLYFPSHPLGQFQKGTRALSRAMRISKEGEPERFGRELNAAVESFTIAINSDPNYLDAYFSRGFSYILGGQRIDLATADFEKCLELKPDHADALFWMGSIQEKYSDYQSALSYYERALELKPGEQDLIDAINEMKTKLAL